MVKEILRLRTDNGGNDPSFHDIEIAEYTYESTRMGMPTLKATLMWPTCLDNEWTGREYVVLRGEKYYIRHTPSSTKSNTDERYQHDLEFHSERDELLGSVYFYDTVYKHAKYKDKPCSNSTKFSFYGDIGEFVDRLNCALKYSGVGDSILDSKTSLTTADKPNGDGYCAMLDPEGDYSFSQTKELSFEDQYLWDAITQAYEAYEIPFEMRGKTIVWGARPNVVSHKFKYGAKNELLSISKKNANAKVINRITMLGSSENIPYYYPNTTEDGQISIWLSDDNFEMAHQIFEVVDSSALIAKVPEGEKVILRKYSASKNNVESISTSWGVESLKPYPLGATIHMPKSESKLNIAIVFNVREAGDCILKEVEGYVWQKNLSRPDGTLPTTLLNAVIPASLTRIDAVESIDNVQIVSNADGILMRGLNKGKYRLLLGARFQPDSYITINYITITNAFGLGKAGYYWAVGEKAFDSIGDLGLRLTEPLNDDMVGDSFFWDSRGRINFQSSLMPPKYRDSMGDERFYNALNETYPIPNTTNDKYVFPNPYIEGSPNEYIYVNEDIKPTIEGVVNSQGQLFGSIADIAFDSDDNDSLKHNTTEEDKNDSLKYEHSYFYIKLHIFDGEYGFNLFKHISQTDPMTIQMRSGNCNGCKFKVQAVEFVDPTGLNYYKNPVQVISPNGDIVSGSYVDKVNKSHLQDFQQDTSQNSIWICVQKDAETFGIVMPNRSNNYMPAIGDTFNIINIDLPEVYILDAERRLEEAGIKYMAENNEEKFTFDISASRIFFADHPEVLQQLDENSKIQIKYNGKEYELYVSSFGITCKGNEPLPDITIQLADTLAVGESFVKRVAQSAANLVGSSAGNTNVGGNGGANIDELDRRYLNKRQADRTREILSSDKGFEVGTFVSGSQGGIFFIDPITGHTYIEVDEMKVRMKAIFEELEISKVSTVRGKQMITPGGSINISFVVKIALDKDVILSRPILYNGKPQKLPDVDAYESEFVTTRNVYRCYFKQPDNNNDVTCAFRVGDEIYCEEFNVSSGESENASNRFYWRAVTNVNTDEGYVDLSMEDCAKGSMEPQAGDVICQFGSHKNRYRQSAIVHSTVDANAPSVTLHSDIMSYSLVETAIIEYGVDKTKDTPEPYFNCYGRFFFGPRSEESYLKFEPSEGQLTYRGKLDVESTIDGKKLAYLPKALANALENSTEITGGLILTTLIKLGYKDEDVYHILAGMNGSYISNLGSKTIASWWGGDMIDRAVNNIANASRALIRMDGTGYFADNVIKVNTDHIMIGDNVRLDKSGVSMINDNGQKFVLTNDSVGSFSSSDIVNVIPIRGGDEKVLEYVVNGDEKSGTIRVTGVKFDTINLIDLSREEIKNGDAITLISKVRFAHDSHLTEDGIPYQCYNLVIYRVFCDKKEVLRQDVPFEPANGGTSDVEHIAPFSATHKITKPGIYQMTVEIIGPDSLPLASTSSASLTIDKKSRFRRGIMDMTRIGNDGAILSYGTTKFFVSEEGVFAAAGDRTLRFTAENGLQIKDSADGAYRTL